MIKELLLIACIDTNHFVGTNKMVIQDSIIHAQAVVIAEQRSQIEKRDALFVAWKQQEESKDVLQERMIEQAKDRGEQEFRKDLVIGTLGVMALTILTLLIK